MCVLRVWKKNVACVRVEFESIPSERVRKTGDETVTGNIKLSIFDIFKIGPGPSSSHTIAPMLAAGDFVKRAADFLVHREVSNYSLKVYLYGSLASTGMGHGTHRAVLAGLLGWQPDSCDCDDLLNLFTVDGTDYEIDLRGVKIKFSFADVCFVDDEIDTPHANTLDFKLLANGKVVFDERYYSIGGGFIKREGDSESPTPIDPPHKYSNLREFRKRMRKTGSSLGEIMMENEIAITGATRDRIEDRLRGILSAMTESVRNGLRADGVLPGPIGLSRKAKALYENAEKCGVDVEKALARLNSFALAAAEENAAGKKVVTAPTSGASGVMPGVVHLMLDEFGIGEKRALEGLMGAALIGFVAKHNASIAGADVGCQGEVGVASSMAAAFAAIANGCDVRRMENAAEIALEHHLGLTCDPVDGYVQVPCIERNAVGAVTAFNAYILASLGDPVKQKVSFDEVLDAMLETGMDMSGDYKETARGGLAVCCVCC